MVDNVTALSRGDNQKRKKYISDFRQKYPEESKRLSDAQILTIFDKKVDFVELKDGLCRIFNIEISTGEKNINDYFGWNNPQKSIELSITGRYCIHDFEKNEHTYYAADGTKLKENYYRKAEETDRMNRTIRKNENNNLVCAYLTDYRSYDVSKGIDNYLNEIEKKIDKAEKENGLFGSLWSGIKNKTGWGDSSNKAREQLKKEREIIKEKGYIEGFTAITGLKATPKNIEDFKNGKIKLQSEKMLQAYKEGQEMAVDIEGDLISGILAFGVYSTAVVAAPFTAGTSIAVGAAAAAGVGAIVKPAVKSIASWFGDYEYTNSFKKDALTGAFSGVLAPISAGTGGAVGKTVACKLGVEAFKHIGKEGIEETAKAGLKETIKTGMLNPAGFKYTSNSFIRREAALASELVTDGVTAGTIDGGFRAGIESDWNAKEIGKGSLFGGLGGLILSPVIGRTMRTTGKISHKAGLSTKESIKLGLKEIEEKATPLQKAIIEELRKNDELMESYLISENLKDIFNPNLFEYNIFGLKTSGYFSNEILKTRLNVLKYINDSPEILDDGILYPFLMNSVICNTNKADLNFFRFIAGCDLQAVTKKIASVKNHTLEHPEMYVNGEYSDAAAAQQAILNFWSDRIGGMMILADNFDNETLGVLMRRRLNDVTEYFQTLHEFTSDDMQTLKKLVNSVNIDNTSFSSNQKIEFIDLIQAYKDLGLDISLISNAVKDGKVDITELHKILLNKVFKKIGMNDEEIASIPKEKLASWDIKYIHLLAQSVHDSDDEIYKDLIKAANTDNFMRYIHDVSNDYGKANTKTKEIFNQKGWDYDAYIKPAKENEVKLVIKDQNAEQLADEGKNFVRIIEQLMQPPMDKIIKKQLSKYMKDDKFVIPEKTLQSKEKLRSFMEGVLKNLDNIKKRAESNLSNPEKATNAKNMVTRFKDMQRILENVKKINTENNKLTQTYDLTIKMIDRNPQKDIFQGNYSTCCIGQGQFNDAAMANYLMNTAYNMIEIVDNKTGKTIGNALCYFVEDKHGNPYFIIDNIEINNSKKCSQNAGKEIRNAITEYAAKVVKQITGKDDIHICMSDNYNDVPTSDLQNKATKIKLIGDVETEHQYMDLFGGWTNSFKENCDLLFLK